MTDQENFERGRTSPSAAPAAVPVVPRAGAGGVASSAGETGSTEPPSVAAQAQDRVQAVAGQAQDKAQAVAGQAQDKAQAAAGQARAQLRDQIEQRSSQAGEQINQQASDLRTVSQSLREQGKDGPANAADRLAGYAERVGGYLHDRGAEQLLHDAEDLGRKRPWAAAGAGAVLGLAASRFMKASSRERYASRSAGLGRVAATYDAEPIGARGGAGVASTEDIPDGTPPLGTSRAPLSGQTPGG